MKTIRITVDERVARFPFASLEPLQGELKSLSDTDFQKLRKSILTKGFFVPMFLWRHGKSDVLKIMDGHQRHRVLGKLIEEGFEIPDVPGVLVEAANEADAKRKLLAITSAFGKIEKEGLYEFLHNAEIEVGEMLDFRLPEIDLKKFRLEFFDTAEPADGEDDVPDPPVDPKTKPGDMYFLDEHRVLCGDSTNLDQVRSLMGGELADMVFTDPPYNTGMTAGKDSARLSHMFNDAYSDEEWQKFMASFCFNYHAIMKSDSVAYICLDWRRNFELIPHIKKHFELSNTIVWDKVVHGLGSDYKYTYELINVCKKGKPELITNQGDDRQYSDVWHIQRKMGRDDDHATKKPIELVERPIRHASQKGQLVVDLFGGSGSTLIACEKTERKCFMMELDPAYCDVIVKRWEDFTGKQAKLVSQGAIKVSLKQRNQEVV